MIMKTGKRSEKNWRSYKQIQCTSIHKKAKILILKIELGRCDFLRLPNVLQN